MSRLFLYLGLFIFVLKSAMRDRFLNELRCKPAWIQAIFTQLRSQFGKAIYFSDKKIIGSALKKLHS